MSDEGSSDCASPAGCCGNPDCKDKRKSPLPADAHAVVASPKGKRSNETAPELDFREQLYTLTKDGRRKWVYAALVKGAIFNRRIVVVTMLLVIYLGLPWLTIGGEQAVMLNIESRKFAFFGTVFYPTDTALLFVILASLGLTLFLASALLGRMWCGWACPQTVFLEFVFRPLERLIEGGPAQRLRLDQHPYSNEWFLKKGLKWIGFVLIAWILASTALAYFWGRENLIGMMSRAPSDNFLPFVLTLSFMTLVLFEFGWFREQFCTLVCPYARFQSVLIDQDSLIVGYDPVRGEPRGKPGKVEGDCVDCGLCVRVCPTGIDIRNGLQLECVQCAACIDACDSIMVKVGRAPGLIRYDSEKNLLRREGTRWFRPRVFLYSALLLALGVAFFSLLATRSLIDFKVVRGGADVPFTVLADGRVTNHLHARIGNKGNRIEAYEVRLVGFPQGTLVVPQSPFPVGPGEQKTLPLFVTFPREVLPSGLGNAGIELVAPDGRTSTSLITLIGPQGNIADAESNP